MMDAANDAIYQETVTVTIILLHNQHEAVQTALENIQSFLGI